MSRIGKFFWRVYGLKRGHGDCLLLLALASLFATHHSRVLLIFEGC